MTYLTAEAMYEYEGRIMKEKGVPTMVLMEAASRAVVRQMKQKLQSSDCVLILATSGNNGADGIAVGRILHNEGYRVHICRLTPNSLGSSENQAQVQIAQAYGCQFVRLEDLDLRAYEVIVDGMFGIGLDRPIEGDLADLIEQVNGLESKRLYAIDIPSGISAQIGQALGPCFRADETITFGFKKYGMDRVELQKCFGEITVDDIGFFY